MNNELRVELLGQILDCFEDFLEEKGVEIWNDEKMESENPAILYGTDYGNLEEEVASVLVNWGLLESKETPHTSTEMVYISELDRFGYTLRAVGKTKREAEDAIINEYVKTYKKWNDGEDPAVTESDRFYGDGRTMLEVARDDIQTESAVLGEVEWT